MIIVKSTKLITVDIDDTLVVWKNGRYYPHKGHIEIVKMFHKRNHTLIAWSAGGFEWAARVIKELKLEKYFSVVMSKPDWFIDDKTSSEFLPEHNRVFIGKNDKLKKDVDCLLSDSYDECMGQFNKEK